MLTYVCPGRAPAYSAQLRGPRTRRSAQSLRSWQIHCGSSRDVVPVLGPGSVMPHRRRPSKRVNSTRMFAPHPSGRICVAGDHGSPRARPTYACRQVIPGDRVLSGLLSHATNRRHSTASKRSGGRASTSTSASPTARAIWVSRRVAGQLPRTTRPVGGCHDRPEVQELRRPAQGISIGQPEDRPRRGMHTGHSRPSASIDSHAGQVPPAGIAPVSVGAESHVHAVIAGSFARSHRRRVAMAMPCIPGGPGSLLLGRRRRGASW
jgi:hypothetical protein